MLLYFSNTPSTTYSSFCSVSVKVFSASSINDQSYCAKIKQGCPNSGQS